MHQKYILLLIFGLLAFGGMAQPMFVPLEEYEECANEEFAENDYFPALAYYRKLIDIVEDPKNKLPQDSSKAFYYLGAARSAEEVRAYRLADSLFVAYQTHPNLGVHPIPNMLTLGPSVELRRVNLLEKMGRYDEAIEILSGLENADSDPRIQGRIEVLETAKLEAESPKNSVVIGGTNFAIEQVRRFPQPINTEHSDYGAYPIGNALFLGRMVYDSPGDEYEACNAKLQIVRHEEGVTTLLQPFEDEGDKANIGHATRNADSTRIILTKCDCVNAKDYRCKLFVKEKTGPLSFSLAQPFNIPGFNSNEHTITHPVIGWDSKSEKEYLFFASNFPFDGHQGSMDIYYAEIDQDGKALAPKNLSRINTPRDEVTPFFLNSSRTLFFSTNGRQGLGGFDIFKIELGESGMATLEQGLDGEESNVEVEKIPSLNSSYNDLYYAHKGNKGYFSSNRPPTVVKEGEDEFNTCCPDIYEVSYRPIRVNLEVRTFNSVDSSALTAVDVGVQFGTDFTETLLPTAGVDSDETNVLFYINVPLSTVYQITGSKDTVLANNLPLDHPNRARWDGDIQLTNTLNINRDTTIRVDLYLTPNSLLHVSLYDRSSNAPLTELAGQLGNVIRKVETNTDNSGTTIAQIDSTDFSVYYLHKQPKDAGVDLDSVEYILDANRNGYFSETSVVGAFKELTTPMVLEDTLYLFRPLPVYFGNAIPDVIANRDGSTLNLNDTIVYGRTNYSARPSVPEAKFSYDKYYRDYTSTKNRDMFKNGNSADPRDKIGCPIDLHNDIDNFFDVDVKTGYNRLNDLSNVIIGYLKEDKSVCLGTAGFASALGDSPRNLALAQRRNDSVRKLFRARIQEDTLNISEEQRIRFTRFIDDSTNIKFALKIIGDQEATPNPDNSRCTTTYRPTASLDRKVEFIALVLEDETITQEECDERVEAFLEERKRQQEGGGDPNPGTN